MVYIYYDKDGVIRPVIHSEVEQEIDGKECISITEEDFNVNGYNDCSLMLNYKYNYELNKIVKNEELNSETQNYETIAANEHTTIDNLNEQIEVLTNEIKELKDLVTSLSNKI